jgi:hypothetical protein
VTVNATADARAAAAPALPSRAVGGRTRSTPAQAGAGDPPRAKDMAAALTTHQPAR